MNITFETFERNIRERLARTSRITIAISDSGGEAYTDSAINQAHRAMMELLRG